VSYIGLTDQEQVAKYLNTTNRKGDKHTTPWCGAFVAWCFDQTKDYKQTNKGLNALAFDWGPKEVADKSRHKPDGWVNGEKSGAFYGAVIVLGYSHTAFIIGKNTKRNKYVFLGGNQSDEIKYGTVTIGQELAIMKPKKYTIPVENKKLKEMSINADGSYKLSR